MNDSTSAAASSPLAGCEHISEQLFTLERMKLALEAGRTGIWDWNLVTGEVLLDARVRALWGLSKDAPANLEVFRAALHPLDKSPRWTYEEIPETYPSGM